MLCNRVEITLDAGMESPMGLVLRHTPNWKAIARTLGLSDNRVKRIESDYPQPERCFGSGYTTINGRAMVKFLTKF